METSENFGVDGIDHINIYSRGKTKLGRGLSHMSRIDLTVDGETFVCMEGYWYWLSTGCKHDEFKTLEGFNAKKLGKTLPRSHSEDFNDKIKIANTIKIVSHELLLNDFIKSTLPFKHYYVYNDHKVTAYESDWLVKMFEDLREELKVKYS